MSPAANSGQNVAADELPIFSVDELGPLSGGFSTRMFCPQVVTHGFSSRLFLRFLCATGTIGALHSMDVQPS